MVSNQITKFQNNKKLIEFLDKMNPADPSAYAHLHAGSEELKEGESKTYSLIGVAIADYSAGTGENKKYACFNLSPQEVKQIAVNIGREIDKVFFRSAFSYGYRQNIYLIQLVFVATVWMSEHMRRLFDFLKSVLSFPLPDGSEQIELICEKNNALDSKQAAFFQRDPLSKDNETVIYSADKLIGKSKDQNGRSPMSRICIKRCKKDAKGALRRSPWQISIDKGTAIAEPTSTGGTKAAAGSYKSTVCLNVWLTDDDIEKLFRTVCDYIRVFEIRICAYGVGKGRKMYQKERISRQENAGEVAPNA